MALRPFDYEKMMSDNEFYSFTSFILANQNIELKKSKEFIEKSQSLNEEITKEINRLQ